MTEFEPGMSNPKALLWERATSSLSLTSLLCNLVSLVDAVPLVAFLVSLLSLMGLFRLGAQRHKEKRQEIAEQVSIFPSEHAEMEVLQKLE